MDGSTPGARLRAVAPQCGIHRAAAFSGGAFSRRKKLLPAFEGRGSRAPGCCRPLTVLQSFRSIPIHLATVPPMMSLKISSGTPARSMMRV